MGISASQAKFLAITSRKVDLEHRMQTICNRRIRLSNEMDKVADNYNRAISDRHLYASQGDVYERITLENLSDLGYKVYDLETNKLVGDQYLPIAQLGANDVTLLGTTNAVTNLHNDLQMLEYVDGLTGQTVQAVGIYSADALEAISSNQGTAGVLSSNYLMMCDANLSGFTWEPIGTGTWTNRTNEDTDTSSSFTGFFNGNQHTISNIELLHSGDGTMRNQGMFGASAGDIRNININGITMQYDEIYNGVTYSGYIGSIVGINQNNGNVQNCNIKNLDMDISSRGDEVGGAVGKNYGQVDKCSVEGTIDIGGDSNDCGSLIGWNNAGNVTQSYTDVDMTIGGDATYTNIFIGDNSANITDSYALGSLTISGNQGASVEGELTDNGGLLDNCYFYDGTNYRFYDSANGADFDNPITYSAADVHSKSPAYEADIVQEYETSEVNGTKVWQFPAGGHPELDFEAVNTYFYDGDDPTIDELEERLRDGTYTIVTEADNYSQETVNFSGIAYESHDWRSTSVVADDLYEGNDYEAQTEYESEVNRINNKDKSLELEQQKVETEYNAITTERDTIKKLLKTNSEKSFKIFS